MSTHKARCVNCRYFEPTRVTEEVGCCRWHDEMAMPFWMKYAMNRQNVVYSSDGTNCETYEPKEKTE